MGVGSRPALELSAPALRRHATARRDRHGLALDPKLLIMDEPTTALDVVVQREILREIMRLREELGFAVLFITHDLALLIEISDRIGIMLEGGIVEEGRRAGDLPQPASRTTRASCSRAFRASLARVAASSAAARRRVTSLRRRRMSDANADGSLEARGLVKDFRRAADARHHAARGAGRVLRPRSWADRRAGWGERLRARPPSRA